MVLSRLTKITGPGVATDTNWVGNNADFTGITTSATSFNIGVTTIHSTLIEAHNIKSTGIITATGGSFSGNVTAVDGTFTGNVSIAGTLTYEDVTNIDSVGIITAPAVDIDDFLDVGSNIKLGNAGVITATSFVGSGAALTGIDATAIKDSGGNVKIQAQASGAVYTGIHTFSSGAEVGSNIKLGNAGVVTATSFTGSGANLTSLPAGQLTGTVADARISTLTASKLSGALPAISGANLTNLDASDLASGTIPDARFPATLPAISGANLTNLDASDLASGTVPTARLGSGTASSSTFLRGDSTFAAVTSTTINNNANNRVITGSGTANTLEGESLLTFDGDTLHLVSSGGDDNNSLRIDGTNNTSGGQVHQFVIENRGESAWVNFKTSTANGSATDRIRINSISGQVRIYNEVYLTDNVPLYLGNSNDLTLFHDSGGTSIIRYNHTVGGLHFRNNSNNDQAILNNSGEFGVGVAPLRKLHVKSGANNNDGAFRVESASGNIMDMGTDGSMHFLNCVNNDPFRIKFAGNEALRVTQETSGNWTTTLQFMMETNNSQGASPYIRGVAGTEANGSDSENAGGLEFHSKTGGSGTDINAMRISHNGRVSIGAHNIQAPTAALHIIGDTQGTNTALQVGQDSAARYFRVNEIPSQSNFLECLLSFYDNSLAHVLKLQNTYSGAANMGTAIQFIGHGGSQTGRIAVKNRDANSASNSIMELSASYITKPSHPYFDVSKSNGTVSSTNVVVYNNVYINNGNHYSNSNGRFTAPVDGHYQFWFGHIKQNTGSVVRAKWRKNGGSYLHGSRELRHDDGAGNYGENGAITIITYLSKNDYVEVVVTQGTIYGTAPEYGYACGTLLG